jgi:hypothetical protein
MANSPPYILDMNLELTDERAVVLERELRRIMVDDRYPLSPRIQMLRAILNKIRPEPVREPPPAPRHYAKSHSIEKATARLASGRQTATTSGGNRNG